MHDVVPAACRRGVQTIGNGSLAPVDLQPQAVELPEQQEPAQSAHGFLGGVRLAVPLRISD